MDPFALLVLAGTGLGTWWLYRREQPPARALLTDGARYEPDAEVALHVAIHEANARGHAWMSPLHVLYGLLQDEEVVEAIRRAGGDAAALEDRVLAALAEHASNPDAAREAGWVLSYAVGVADQAARRASCVDLWAALTKADSEAAALVESAGARRVDVLFLLFHGAEPEVPDGLPGDVHAVLRNDHYTTRDFVCDVLEQVFELSAADAAARMQTTHDTGRAVIARYPARVARAKILEARRRAKESGFPLWIGVEPI